jgi:hypothetical protein
MLSRARPHQPPLRMLNAQCWMPNAASAAFSQSVAGVADTSIQHSVSSSQHFCDDPYMLSRARPHQSPLRMLNAQCWMPNAASAAFSQSVAGVAPTACPAHSPKLTPRR